MTAYDRALAKFTRIATLNEAAAILGWDGAAVMPDGGAAARGEQMAVLAGLSHELITEPALADDLAAAEAPNDEWRQVNLTLMREAQIRAAALPRDLVEAAARANAACETIWRRARPESDFAAVCPALTEVFNLTRQSAGILGEKLGCSPYDALVGGWQRGLAAAEARQRQNPGPLLPPGPYPAAAQEKLCRQLAEAAGLDFRAARLDKSAHPFCGGTPTDIRITTRYDEDDFAAALMGVLHETGHALYEQNTPKEFARQKVGESAGMAVHESQSLIVEMQAVRSDGYLSWLAPLVSEAFGPNVSDGALKSRLRYVERTFIRVEADEMTYPAHVLLRFRLEQAMLAGDLKVADLPGAWNEGFEALLGITPPDDRRGCLQDIHWHDGIIGYFPSYTLGAMAAAQLMAAARLALPGLDEALGRGDLSPLVGWLTENVHRHGARLGFNDLLAQATGEALNPAHFEAHLAARYL